MTERLTHAELVSKFYVAKEFSYSTERAAGDGEPILEGSGHDQDLVDLNVRQLAGLIENAAGNDHRGREHPVVERHLGGVVGGLERSDAGDRERIATLVVLIDELQLELADRLRELPRPHLAHVDLAQHLPAGVSEQASRAAYQRGHHGLERAVGHELGEPAPEPGVGDGAQVRSLVAHRRLPLAAIEQARLHVVLPQFKHRICTLFGIQRGAPGNEPGGQPAGGLTPAAGEG